LLRRGILYHTSRRFVKRSRRSVCRCSPVGGIISVMSLLEQLRLRREAILEIARRYGASQVRVLGSVARGEASGAERFMRDTCCVANLASPESENSRVH